MWRIRFIGFFLVVFLQQFPYAQQFSYKNFNTDNGFPSSESYAILQDKMGYMWFGTDHGVARYNGEEFTTYTTADGLVDNTILRMAEDSKGRIWFIGHNNEICYWDKGHIIIPPFSAQLAHSLQTWESVKTFYIDKNDDLWINAVTSIYHIHTSGKIFLEKQKKIENCDIAIKIIDDKKALYFINREGKFSKNENGHFAVKIGYEVNGHIYYKIVDRDLNSPLTFGSVAYSQNKTLFFYARKTLVVIPKNGEIEFKTFEDEILDLSIDRDNDLWIGFRKAGVMYYKNADIKSMPISFLDNSSVNSTYRDHEGGVWLSTLERGIFYVPSTSIIVYPNIPFLNDKISFIGATNDNVFIKTFGIEFTSGIYSVTTYTIAIQQQLMDFQKRYERFNSIHQSGDTLYADYSSGILLLTPDLKFIDELKNRNTVGIRQFIGSDSTTLYYARSNGLLQINKATKVAIIYPTPFRTSSSLFKNNELLVGGKKGLYSFKDGKYLSLGYIDPLLKKSIVDMKIDQTGGLWLATANDGLICFKDKHSTHYTKPSGLISNVCTSLTIDDHNNIWVGTTSGISQLSYLNEKEGWKIKNFTKKNGFNSNEITKLFADKDTLWVGTMSGLSHAVISEITAPEPLCAVYIDSIKMNNKNIGADKKSFSYDENNFKFETAALTFVDQGRHLFRHRLIGLDTTWVETKTNELSFNRLPSGDFQFEVQAANTDKVWSHSATYKFTIHKPFWFTYWFILLEVILVIVIIYLIILLAVKRITRKEKEKARINKLLAEYQMKALTSQMNPHFIFNAINSIQNFILLNDGDIAYDYLEKFSRLIRTVLTNSEKKEVTLQNELDTMALYIELEQLRFENAFEYVCEVDACIDAADIVIPTLVIQPYIENAIWHGLMPLDRKGHIILRITKQDNKLKIMLTDDGIGRKASDMITKKVKSEDHPSMGTNLTSSRIKLFGDDATNSVQIIDNYNDQQEATGTTVEIILPLIENY
jgi:ligand-binding sensor domain-containing protein/competence protein ComGC